VKGKTLAGAMASLQAAHCRTGAIRRRYSSRVRKGRVISQGVAAGTKLANGAAVSLAVSKGRAPVKVTVCYRHRTLHVTKAVARNLRKRGATLGACRRR
jgi:beta-lactam-binding protein with PASTA domain